MVSVEYDDGGLSPVFHGFHKIPRELVHLIDLVHIVLPLVLRCLVLDPLHLDGGIFKHLFFRIVAMALHADGEDKVSSIRGIHRVHHMLHQNIIFGPSIFRGLQNVHELLAGKTVKANIIKYSCPAVEVSSVIVERVGSIPKRCQGSRRALAGLILKNRLIGIFSRPEIPQVHACQHFEFCICRASSYGRHLKVTGRIILVHLMQVWTCVLGSSKEFGFIHVKVRL